MPGHNINDDATAGPCHVDDGFEADRSLIDASMVDISAVDAPDVAELRCRLRAAEREVAELKEALASQRLIGVAVGLLAHRFQCSPEQSWQLLVRLSQTTNVKVREIARVLTDAHAGGDVTADAELLAMLATQLPGENQKHHNSAPEQ